MPILESVAQEACMDCSRREICWKKEFPQTSSDLLAAAEVQERHGRILWEEDFSEGFRERCLRLSYVTESVRKVCGAYSLRRRMKEEIRESRLLVSQQLRGVARVMSDLSAEIHWQPEPQADQARQIRTRLRGEEIAVRGVSVTKDASGRYRVRLMAENCGGCRRCVHQIAPILSSILQCPMQWVPAPCGEGNQRCKLTFVQSRILTVEASAMQWAASGDCGDSCLRLSLGNKGYLMAISDGMGVGEAAARESRRVLKLVEEFYRAGFEEEVIFRTINQMLLLRPSGETFATVDLCLLDLVTAKAHFIKLGAAPSYLVRDGHAVTITGPSLPIGIVEEMRPASVTWDLVPGDLVVLCSDGLSGADDYLSRRLPELVHLPPERIARVLLQEADHRGGLRVDDRTVMIAQIGMPLGERTEEWKNRRMLRWKSRVAEAADA